MNELMLWMQMPALAYILINTSAMANKKDLDGQVLLLCSCVCSIQIASLILIYLELCQ